MSKMNILVADDHTVIRYAMSSLLSSQDFCHVVAEAEDGATTQTLIKVHKPDVVLLDLNMPVKNGIETLEWSKTNFPEIKVVLLTMYSDEALLEKALELGVDGYVLKDDSYEQVIECLKCVMGGNIYISPSISKHRDVDPPLLNQDEFKKLKALSLPQLRVVELVAQNLSSKEIGKVLGLSYRTVQNHRQMICKSLDLTGNNALAYYALKNLAVIKKQLHANKFM